MSMCTEAMVMPDLWKGWLHLKREVDETKLTFNGHGDHKSNNI